MKIAIIGAQGVGKTTLAEQINKDYPNFKILPEAARLAKEAGYNINQTATININNDSEEIIKQKIWSLKP